MIYIFLIYYGFTFVSTNQYADAFRYAEHLRDHALLPFSEFFRIVGGLYSGTSVDIVEPLISFVVSRFTSHHGLYFAIWAAIFGYFYLKSINLLHVRYKENPGWSTMIPMAFFIMILPITAVGSVRMWTAAWIFFYSAYHVVLYRNPKYLLLAFAASFMHWSFFSANAILLIYYLAGNRNYIYLPLAAASFFVPRLFIPLMGNLSFLVGGAIQTRYEGYSSEGFINSQHELIEQSSWFLQLATNLVFYYLLLAIFMIQIGTAKTEKDQSMRNLYSFLLLFLAFVNFGMPIPSFGGRFQVVFFLFATLYVFLYFVRVQTTRMNLLSLLGIFPMALYASVVFRVGTESISVWIFTPILGSPLFAPILSLSDLLFH